MATPWVSLQASTPTALTTLGQTISTGVNALKTLLEAVQTQARINRALLTDPRGPTLALANQAVQVAVTAADQIVTSLLDGVGVYCLLIPIPKKGMVSLLADSSPGQAGSNFIEAPLIPTLNQSAVGRFTLFQDLINPENLLSGGNAYFLRTVFEAMFDSGDSSRPRMQPTDSFVYALFVAGAEDLALVLPTANYLDRFLGGRSRLPANRGTTNFIPNNIRASLTGRQRTASLEWDYLPPGRVLASYDQTRVIPIEFAIIRSTDFRMSTAPNVAELFGNTSLTKGQQGRYGSTVVDVISYDGIRTRWTDTLALTPNVDYYYRVAFRSRVTSPSTEVASVDLPYDLMSPASSVRSTRRSPAAVTHGKPPDWARSPSVAAMFPAIEEFLDNMRERLRTFGASTQSASDQFDGYLSALQREIDRYTEIATDALLTTQNLTRIFSLPTSAAGLAMKVSMGSGGFDGFSTQLFQDFSDYSDPNRPAFDTGGEFVTGAIVLAFGPDLAAIASQFDFLTALFGGTPSTEVQTGIDSVPQLTLAVDAAAAAVQAAEVATGFQSDMTSGNPDAQCSTAAPTAPEFDEGMREI